MIRNTGFSFGTYQIQDTVILPRVAVTNIKQTDTEYLLFISCPRHWKLPPLSLLRSFRFSREVEGNQEENKKKTEEGI
jgi:hypothetical protein